MAVQTPTAVHQFLGLVMWGDLGPLTMYRSGQGRLVIFKKTWPDTPPTPPQVAARESMTTCGRSWQGLTPAMKAGWRMVARRLSLAASGYNLWVSWRFKQDVEKLLTLMRQSGVVVQTRAQTTTIYDPRYRLRVTRLSKTVPDPWVFFLPYNANVGPDQTCILWFIPWSNGLGYARQVTTDYTINGVGSIATYPAYNKWVIPIFYTAPPGTGSAKITVAITWPDESNTTRSTYIKVDGQLS